MVSACPAVIQPVDRETRRCLLGYGPHCSEEVGGNVGIYKILEKGVCAVKLTFWQRVTAGHQEQMPT